VPVVAVTVDVPVPAVGLAVILNVYRSFGTIEAQQVDTLKG